MKKMKARQKKNKQGKTRQNSKGRQKEEKKKTTISKPNVP